MRIAQRTAEVRLAPAGAGHPLQQSPSEREGNHLKYLSTEIANGKIYQVKQATTDSDFLYAATQRGLFASMDGGQSWSEVPLPSQTQEIFALAVKPVVPSHLWAGTREGLWSSQDGGQSWVRISSNLPGGLVPLSLSVARTSELVYMGTARQGLFRSQDSGLTWQEISSGLPEGIGASQYGAFSSLALSPANDVLVLVGTELGEIYRTQDAGSTWESANGIPEPATRRTYPPLITFDPLASEIVYAILSRPVHSDLLANTLYKSVDSGASWFAIKELRDNERYLELAVEPNQPRVLFLTGEGSFLRIEDVFPPPELDRSDSQRGTLEALDLGKLGSTSLRMDRADGVLQTTLDQDFGNIAVLVDDGELIKNFDLDGTTIQFTPNEEGYDIDFIGFTFDPTLGSDLSLADDAFSQQSLGFTFPFYGTNYIEVFVNSNGNLTFGESDTSSIESLLVFIVSLKSKIAPLWDDFDPTSGGGVFFKTDDTDQAVITWSGVPESGTSNSNTFQVILSSDGMITFSYNQVAARDGLVGLSNGQLLFFPVNYTLDLPQAISGEPVAEIFTGSIDTEALSKRFYASHPDDFDQLIVFGASSFTQNIAGEDAFAFHQTVKNDISGIGRSISDRSSSFGSAGRLQSFINMNVLSPYPDDPNTDLLGTNNTLDILGQEVGHRWGASVSFDDGGMDSPELLGRDLGHWSFFLDSDASDLEGNSWVDNSDGSFTTDEATERFSALDQYLMGVLPDSQVAPFFFIKDPPSTFDLDGTTLQFTPNTNGGYDVASIEFTFDPTLGTDLSLGVLDSSQQSLGFTFPFYGTNYSEVFVNFSGNLTFEAGSLSFSESVEDFVKGTLPRIAGLWDLLNPEAGGAVFFKTDGSSQAIITWNGVPEFFPSNSNTFQITLESSGAITITYDGVALQDGLVGISNCCQASVNDSFPVDYSQDLPLSGFTARPIYEQWLGFSASSSPQIGVTLSGTRQDVTISQVQTSEGPRDPTFGDAPTTFTEAFILLVPKGEVATEADLVKLEGIRIAWEGYFNTATGGRASVVTSLEGSVGTTLIANFVNGNTDAFNSRIYLSNFSVSPGSVAVRVFTLPPLAGTARELTIAPLSLGILGAKSALNIKLAEDILTFLVPLPYKENGGNLTLEFTIGSKNVRGVAQVFSGDFAFGTYQLQEIQ